MVFVGVRDLEWSSVYDSDSTSPFSGKFRIARFPERVIWWRRVWGKPWRYRRVCISVSTSKSRKPQGWKGTMYEGNLATGGMSTTYWDSLYQIVVSCRRKTTSSSVSTRSYNQDIKLCLYTTSANKLPNYTNTRYITSPSSWALIRSKFAVSTDRLIWPIAI